MPSDAPIRELASVTLNVSIDVSVLERGFKSDSKQQDFDAAYYNNVVAKLVYREAACQYAKHVAKLRAAECLKR